MNEKELFEEEGYELADRLGTDSWGALYRAVYRPHGLEVLFRRFPETLRGDGEAWALMRSEIGAWSRLDHPGILRVLDWGAAGAGAFLAMEMPAGLPLARVLEVAEGAPAYGELFGPLLEAVEHARNAGCLHLGLNPGNVWVCHDGNGCRVQVAEFGLWYVSDRHPLAFPCDDAFLAPEQRTGGRASAASDVYSLGLLLASVVSGRGDPGDVEDAPCEAPPEVASVVACCLAEQPLARYATAGELSEALGFGLPANGPDERDDCPICRLQREIASRNTDRPGRRSGARKAPYALSREEPASRPEAPARGRYERYVWYVIGGLVLATLLVWWAAFR